MIYVCDKRGELTPPLVRELQQHRLHCPQEEAAVWEQRLKIWQELRWETHCSLENPVRSSEEHVTDALSDRKTTVNNMRILLYVFFYLCWGPTRIKI